MPNFTEAFTNPANTYRPMPFWVWNGKVTKRHITERLEQFAAQGCGGVFIHPRAGLVTDYLSDDWFAMWSFSLHECKRLGLECHIYDENSYPSGFAGGHTIAENPHHAGSSLSVKTHYSPEGPEPRSRHALLSLYERQPDGAPGKPLAPQALQDATPERPVISFGIAPNGPSWWMAGRTYVDLLAPGPTQTFLQVTHDEYAKRFSPDFGKTIRYAFADEPTVSKSGLPLSRFLLREFKTEHGYDLTPRLPDLYFDTEDSPSVRFDYWLTVNRLFIQNYVKACHDWCEKHSLAFTGHFHETAWPSPKNQPSTMAALRWMQAPGNDLLGFQFEPSHLAQNDIYLLNLKELGSIARQCGRERVLTESTGGGGYGFALRDFKPIEDFLLCFGVNVINPHLSHQSLAGSRKYDWAHTISDHTSWWDHYRPYADHIARVNSVLSAGIERNRVLLLHPDSSGWITWTPAEDRPKEVGSDACQKVRDDQLQLAMALYQAGIDYDLGDEFTLAEMGDVVNSQLRVGQATYHAVIVPPSMLNALASTPPILQAFLEAGGTVIAPDSPTRWLNGRPDSTLNDLLATRREKGVVTASSIPDIVRAAAQAVPPRIEVRKDSPNLCWRRVEQPDAQTGEPRVAWFFCNPFDTPLETSVLLHGSDLLHLDTLAGETLAAHSASQPVELKLAPRGHALLISPSADAPSPRKTPSLQGGFISLGQPSIKAHDVNTLAIDYCELEANGETHPPCNTIHADSRNWLEQGFDQCPWSFSIQYRQTFIEWPVAPDSGFAVRYRFQIASDCPQETLASLRIAIERPLLYQIELNGHAIDPAQAERWFDEDMAALPIGEFARPGENVLSLDCHPFNPLAEIAPVVLLGDFSVTPAPVGFAIDAATSLPLGNWIDQGRPFYHGKVSYAFPFELNEAADSLHLDLAAAQWQGSIALAAIDSQEPQPIAFPPYQTTLPGPFNAGKHTLAITVAGNLKNLLGPHHVQGLSGPWTWQRSPASQPPGQDYTFHPSGLLHPPKLSR